MLSAGVECCVREELPLLGLRWLRRLRYGLLVVIVLWLRLRLGLGRILLLLLLLLLLSGVGTCGHILASQRIDAGERSHPDLNIGHVSEETADALADLFRRRSAHQTREYVV